MIKHAANFQDLTGQRFGRLLVLSFAKIGKDSKSQRNVILLNTQ